MLPVGSAETPVPGSDSRRASQGDRVHLVCRSVRLATATVPDASHPGICPKKQPTNHLRAAQQLRRSASLPGRRCLAKLGWKELHAPPEGLDLPRSTFEAAAM